MANRYNKMEEINVDVDGLIKELKEIVKVKGDDLDEDDKNIDVIGILDGLVSATNNPINGNLECEIGEIFLKLLSHKSIAIVAKSAKAIAEIAKTETGRVQCTDSDLIRVLLKLMEKNEVEIVTQSSRALGNICYNNEKGNKLVQENDGLRYIFSIIKRGVNLGKEQGADLLRNVAAGFLLNYLVDQKSLQKTALDQNLVEIACDVLDIDTKSDGKAASHIFLTLEIVNDSGFQFLDERLTKVLVSILASDESWEMSQICLELLHGQAENESAKMLLAKAGVCELLVNLLEKHVSRCIDEETRGVLRTACNLIVLIITGDESMNYLYDNSNGEVYKKLISWLEDGHDEDLQVAAVLAMGNFARTDAHCQLMVAQGVHRRLLHLLTKNNENDGDIRFQHALLSAVRNLVIPNKNKPIMLDDGLINVIYPMISIPTFPVVFKLLGTLRIVIDGQENAASLLGTKEELLKKTIEWCNTEEHPGVQGEANRLIAWIVINSKNRNVVLSFIEHGAIPYLVKMVTAPHALMQNEALMSLTLITILALKECEVEFVKVNIAEVLIDFFDESALKLSPEIVQNAMTFINLMMRSDHLKNYITTSSFRQSLEMFLDSANDWLPNQENQMVELLENFNI